MGPFKLEGETPGFRLYILKYFIPKCFLVYPPFLTFSPPQHPADGDDWQMECRQFQENDLLLLVFHTDISARSKKQTTQNVVNLK